MKDSEKWLFLDNTLEKKNIPFHIPLVTGSESEHVNAAIRNKYLGAGGDFTKKCSSFLEDFTGCKKVIMTTSCTDALEMAAILADIKEGDEVIMASFNFVSAANAFVMRGAKICFVDIDQMNMNIDAKLIEAAISPRTKVIVAMHYSGVPCEMDTIMGLAEKYNLLVVEDAAHCIGAFYKDRHLGSIGHLGAISFHETKNIQCGEGGALMINDERLIQRALIIRDKGTNRSDFNKGIVKKYTWVDIGSSFGLSELNAAFLFGQLLQIQERNQFRIDLCKQYKAFFSDFKKHEIPEDPGNGHIFYVKFDSVEKRDRMIDHLKTFHIEAVSHYEPLHQSVAGKKYGYFSGEDNFTTKCSKTLLRLPLHQDINNEDILYLFQRFMQVYEM
ncbi:MAG: dTDP-4-amino-4,6-dideoxygalactose transaminase [Saprospiraceae bacterium]|nr:dTDP-4-amino-4,6-dideoxygalactose transaminase [Saprospiraceae bacterium]